MKWNNNNGSSWDIINSFREYLYLCGSLNSIQKIVSEKYRALSFFPLTNYNLYGCKYYFIQYFRSENQYFNQIYIKPYYYIPSFIFGILFSLSHSNILNNNEILEEYLRKYNSFFIKFSIIFSTYLIYEPNKLNNPNIVAFETLINSLTLPLFTIKFIDFQKYYLSEYKLNYFNITFDKNCLYIFIYF